jgi:hypothetical protein
LGAFVQSQATYTAASGTTQDQAMSPNVVTGNTLAIIVASFHDTATISSVVQQAGTATIGTITQVGSLVRATTQNPYSYVGIYTAPVTAGGSCTIRATVSTAHVDRTICVYEASGVTVVGLLAAGAQGASTSPLSGAVTLSVPGFAIKVVNEWEWGTHNQAAGTPSTGWTERHDLGTGFDTAYQNFTSGPGTLNGGFTISPSAAWVCRVLALLDSAGAAATSLVIPQRTVRNSAGLIGR